MLLLYQIKMFKCKDKLWLEDITQLFCSTAMIPLQGMGLAAQMNSITRIVLIVFVILLLLGFHQSLLFLLLSLLFIIILYYIQRNQMTYRSAENYIPPAEVKALNTAYREAHKTSMKASMKEAIMTLTVDPRAKAICSPPYLIEPNNPEYITETQRRVGPANPKTFINPLVAPKVYDDSWKANNITFYPGINERKQFDTARSGYQVTTCCGSTEPCPDIEPPPMCGEALVYGDPIMPLMEVKTQCTKEDYTPDVPYIKEQTQPSINICENQPGWVNAQCGYNPEQKFTAGLPANYAVGNCPQQPAMKEHNEAVFTQTIQPGVYMRSDVNEPINSNIGISYTQQNQPTAQFTDPNTGEVLFIEEDPRLLCGQGQKKSSSAAGASITEADVFDPRFNGYGTSYRSYLDDVTGQVRFYYDDIDAVRIPNYITRNNIDHTTFGDTYGTIPEGFECGNPRTSDIRALAQDAFLNASLCHRNEVQFALMRKTNNQRWQQRIAPISKMGQAGPGSSTQGATR
jgi:hypothetical protein